MQGTTVPFILPGLLASMAFLLKQSTISPFEGTQQGICMYTVLIANPSTGKSPALNTVQDLIYKIEDYRQIPPEKSPIISVGSIEGLLEYLSSIQCMIGESFLHLTRVFTLN